MPRAGFCAKCGSNVWLDDNGGCVNGHPAESVTGVYETEPANTQPASSGPSFDVQTTIAEAFTPPLGMSSYSEEMLDPTGERVIWIREHMTIGPIEGTGIITNRRLLTLSRVEELARLADAHLLPVNRPKSFPYVYRSIPLLDIAGIEWGGKDALILGRQEFALRLSNGGALQMKDLPSEASSFVQALQGALAQREPLFNLKTQETVHFSGFGDFFPGWLGDPIDHLLITDERIFAYGIDHYDIAWPKRKHPKLAPPRLNFISIPLEAVKELHVTRGGIQAYCEGDAVFGRGPSLNIYPHDEVRIVQDRYTCPTCGTELHGVLIDFIEDKGAHDTIGYECPGCDKVYCDKCMGTTLSFKSKCSGCGHKARISLVVDGTRGRLTLGPTAMRDSPDMQGAQEKLLNYLEMSGPVGPIFTKMDNPVSVITIAGPTWTDRLREPLHAVLPELI